MTLRTKSELTDIQTRGSGSLREAKEFFEHTLGKLMGDTE